jgi:integrase
MNPGKKYLTKEEVDRFFKVIENQRDFLIFTLMLRQGLRVGEVVGETLDYWAKDGVRIPESSVPKEIFMSKPNTTVKHGENKYCHHIRTIEGIYIEDIDWNEKNIYIRGKGKKPRVLPLHTETYLMLNDFIRPAERTPEQMAGPIFDIRPPMVRHLCHDYARKAGIARRIHPHIFRHTFAVGYLKKGGNIRALQKMLGHTSLQVTAHYLDLVEDDIRKDFDKVEMSSEVDKDKLAKGVADLITSGEVNYNG